MPSVEKLPLVPTVAEPSKPRLELQIESTACTPSASSRSRFIGFQALTVSFYPTEPW